MTICIVGGISGAGKTSIVSEFQRRQGNCEVVRGSEALFDALGLQRDDYTALRAISDEVKDAVFAESVTTILDQSERFGTILIDAHYLNFKAGRARSGVGPWIKRVDILVLVETDPVIVHKRMEADKDRRRDRLPQGSEGHRDERRCVITLEEAMEATRIEARRLSLLYEKPLWEIDNSSELSSAVDRLVLILESQRCDNRERTKVQGPI